MADPSSSVPEAQHRKALLFLVFTAVLWSLGGLLIKSIAWHPIAIAGVRSIFAAALMLVYYRRFDFTWSLPQIGGAVAYAGTVILFVSATKMTTAANAIILQYTAPVYTAILGALFLKEKTTRSDWLTIAVVFCGMGLFFLDKLTVGNMIGNVLGILSGVSFSTMLIFLRHQREDNPFQSLILGNLLTALVCAPFIIGSTPGLTNWGIALVLGVFQLGVSYILYAEAVKHVRALDAIMVPIIEPILNPVWVLIFLGEIPGPWALLGGIVVLGAVSGRYLFAGRQGR
jgi:drug/metabolite transporter (DMT)-like permease